MSIGPVARALHLFLPLVALLATVCGSQAVPESSSPTPPTPQPPTPPAQASPTIPLPTSTVAPVRIGDTIPAVGIQNQQLAMIVLRWIKSEIAVDGPYVGDAFYTFTAQPGRKFIILEFTLRNDWVRAQTSPYLTLGDLMTDKAHFYDLWSPPAGIHSDGYSPRPSSDEEIRTFALIGAYVELLPGESTTGRIAFEIPEGEEPRVINLAEVPVPIQMQ